TSGAATRRTSCWRGGEGGDRWHGGNRRMHCRESDIAPVRPLTIHTGAGLCGPRCPMATGRVGALDLRRCAYFPSALPSVGPLATAPAAPALPRGSAATTSGRWVGAP